MSTRNHAGHRLRLTKWLPGHMICNVKTFLFCRVISVVFQNPVSRKKVGTNFNLIMFQKRYLHVGNHFKLDASRVRLLQLVELTNRKRDDYNCGTTIADQYLSNLPKTETVKGNGKALLQAAPFIHYGNPLFGRGYYLTCHSNKYCQNESWKMLIIHNT